MSNLFPGENYSIVVEDPSTEDIKFKPSYAFDFVKGEFRTNPDGTVVKCDEFEAYVQWCTKVMLTPRYKLGYSWAYGHELKNLTGSSMNKDAIELEIKRMTVDALLAHPKTKEVDNFQFIWSEKGNEVIFTYEVTTIYKESFLLKNDIKVR